MSYLDRFAACTFLVLVSSLTAVSARAEIVANFYDDYDPDVNGVVTASGTWHYLWNRPVGWTGGALTGATLGDITTAPLSDTSNFAILVDAGSVWTADGNGTGTDSNPDRYVRFSGKQAGTSVGLHPGAQVGFDVGAPGDVNNNQINSYDRYPIAAFTVNKGGFYRVVDGQLWTTTATSNGVDVWAFATGQSPTLLGNSTGGTNATTAFNFSHVLGYLSPGDTIYVAYGTNGNPGSDSSYTDFSIDVVPEPSTLVMLLGLAGVGLLGYLRRRRRN